MKKKFALAFVALASVALLAVSIAAYTLIIACCLPAYWLHPFAPLVKNLPLLALTVYFYQQTRSSRWTT